MADNNKKKKSSGSGFYVALCCLVAAIGVVGFLNSRNEEVPTENTKPVPTAKVMSVPVITVEPVQEEVPAATEAAPVAAPKIHEVETFKPDISDEYTDVIEAGENVEFYDGPIVESVSIIDTPSFVIPVDGDVCFDFSGDTLYYDSTMGDYRTHNGIDIAAEPDSDVVAAADGVIEEVYTGNLGKTVVINHNNGYTTLYANLDDVENLKPGMEIEQGEFIAHVGDYSLGEQTSEPHIHFELMCNGVLQNPKDYID